MIHNSIPERIARHDREIVIAWNSEHIGHYPAPVSCVSDVHVPLVDTR